MIKKGSLIIFVLLVVLFLLSGLFYINQAAHAHFVAPKKGDACPICGMSVSEHPIWVAVIMFSDGKHVKLHGPKSMFTYFYNLENYNEKYKKKDVATMHVTAYNTLEHLRAENAYYVINSNIKGPMGADLIPFKDRASAEVFIKEHGGTIMLFKNITREIVNSLKNIVPDKSPTSQ